MVFGIVIPTSFTFCRKRFFVLCRTVNDTRLLGLCKLCDSLFMRLINPGHIASFSLLHQTDNHSTDTKLSQTAMLVPRLKFGDGTRSCPVLLHSTECELKRSIYGWGQDWHCMLSYHGCQLLLVIACKLTHGDWVTQTIHVL